MGRLGERKRIPLGWKTPLDLLRVSKGRLIPAVSSSGLSFVRAALCLFFNGLRGERTFGAGKFGKADCGPLCEHLVGRLSERFGPNFVTIMRTGVYVCSN